ncbi:transcription initiation factor IIA gamma subunit [Mycena rosella]|uniref:Transcription initiation factor IIA subunit 2 n=1 Tax=Mycena rosella TaxID=1033263 RepID=A0AAD7CYN6_MYCRO|nr:transcription initiation factor IIA gamma subunit [Mycena rosella]
MSNVSYEIYRGSSLGIALLDSLDEFVRENIISVEQARAVLDQFDKVVVGALAVKAQARASVKAHLRTYRLCEEVWYFSLRNATFKMDGRQTVSTPRVKIVAIKTADVIESEVPTPQTSPMKRY